VPKTPKSSDHHASGPAPEENLDSLATLAGGVAHEFNTVLSIVLGYTQLIPDIAADPVRLRETLDIIKQAACRGADVVYQLQLFARTRDYPHGEQDVHELIRDSIAHSTRQWPATIQVRVDLNATPVILPLNAAQFILALQHLLQNARASLSADTGAITLATRLHADTTPPRLCVSVEDNGSGMDSATSTRSTEPFFTRHTAAARRGLGLSVVHGIVHAHGGFLEIDSEPLRGTRVKIWLPVEAAGSPTAPSAARSAAEHTRSQLTTARAYLNINSS
jgi:two-component system, cell cycle sensor histidine kinase and response regulator CckA